MTVLLGGLINKVALRIQKNIRDCTRSVSRKCQRTNFTAELKAMKRKLEENEDSTNTIKEEGTDRVSNTVSIIPEEFREKHIKEFGDACDHILKIDGDLLDAITQNDFPLFLKKDQVPKDTDHYFTKLASAILAQQISGAAAKSIKKRFMDHFGGEFPSAMDVHHELSDTERRQEIRACGLSGRKMIYLESLTDYFVNHAEEILSLFETKGNDDEVIQELTENIKGIGKWSAKMFLVTGLERMDIFASEDLGIARGCSNYLGTRPWLVKELIKNRISVKRSKIKHKKLNWKIYDDDLVEACADRFSPYRTVLMFILWRLSSTNVDAMAKNEADFSNK
ncbi:hypothetical protein HG535_0B01350 [Zygotorulaspora mrakii]|uniref:HhH-GPD domain-containing protein n=1 Tax=Zygotorulaspora mrakii TaxID=42260 RepID=A0A7H9AY50_ZYGMR|nr:uncharacterized protein HG535_0B01350 [Zygotorulaspora mrakii]QLG71097.1 hypothetical protein HG535_0B01350 [Zygotorulaspora mrakii]